MCGVAFICGRMDGASEREILLMVDIPILCQMGKSQGENVSFPLDFDGKDAAENGW